MDFFVAEKSLLVVQLTVVVPNVADRNLGDHEERHFHTEGGGDDLVQVLIAGIADRTGKVSCSSL